MLTGLDLVMTFFLAAVAFVGILLGLTRMGLLTLTFVVLGTAIRLGSPVLAPFLERWILSYHLRILAGAFLIVLVCSVLLYKFGKILLRARQRLKLVWLDRLLGGSLSLALGWLVLALALGLLLRVPAAGLHEVIQASTLAPLILKPIPDLFFLGR